MQTIERDLVGVIRPDLSPIIFDELRHRVNLKLRIGERVVICGRFTDDAKHQLSNIATNLGLCVIDDDVERPAVRPPSLRNVASEWNGITVIGDVHGNLEALKAAILWARARHNFMWFLGDIIDYGAATLETMTTVYHAVMAGTAGMVLGNHERKIARWLDQRENGKINVHLSDGNKVTTQALAQLSKEKQRQWVGQFRSLLAHTSLLCTTHDITLIHGAIHPTFWSSDPDHDAIEQYALYGESEHKGKKYRRTYHWVDHVPMDQTVVVGHDMKHDYPLVKTGAKGGQTIFLDTGCGKGGRLSSADLRFYDKGLKLECFKRY